MAASKAVDERHAAIEKSHANARVKSTENFCCDPDG
jgi:hypothetical protein